MVLLEGKSLDEFKMSCLFKFNHPDHFLHKNPSNTLPFWEVTLNDNEKLWKKTLLLSYLLPWEKHDTYHENFYTINHSYKY